METYDCIIIGGGIAGLSAAVALAKEEKNILIITKQHPMRTHSVMASGGINAGLFTKEEQDQHR